MDSLTKQIGGDHYQKRAIQPIEYILDNDLNFCEGCVIKYVTRWRDKGGIEDLRKAKHYLEFLIEQEERKPPSEALVEALNARAQTNVLGSVSVYAMDDPGDSTPVPGFSKADGALADAKTQFNWSGYKDDEEYPHY